MTSNKKVVLVPMTHNVDPVVPKVKGKAYQAGDEVQLIKGGSLAQHGVLCIQYCSAGTKGEVLGYDGNDVIVRIEGEDWVVEEKNLRKVAGQTDKKQKAKKT